MSSKRCCVPQCVEVEGSYRVLHWFPNPDKDIARFRTWVHAIGAEILSLSNENIYKLRRVCHAHFEQKYCCRNNKISNIAVPTLLMPGPISKFICNDRKPFREVENLPSTSKGLPLHRFPNPNNPAQIERFRIWVMKIGGDIIGEDNKFVHKNRKVCHKHFEDIYIFPNMKLTALAIPTLEIPGVHVGERGHIELPFTPIQRAAASSTRPIPMDTDLSSRPGNVMHSFPNPNKFPERFKAWVNLVGYNLETLTDCDIYKKKRICDIHFTDEHRNRFKRLNALAMPTLYLPEGGLHVFPNPINFPEQFNAWVRVVSGQDECELDYKKLRICSRHFTKRDWNRNNRLNALAVPSLFLHGETTPSTQEEFDDCADPVPTASKASLASLSTPGTGPTIDIEQTPNSSGVENTDICDDNDDADDDSDTLVESNVCRVCLALDVKMYELKDIELREMFQNITGIAVSENNHPILERLCWECTGRLKAAAAFRNKALLSDALLQGLASTGEQIRKNDITSIKENQDYLKSVGCMSAVEVFHVVDIDPENDSVSPISENNDTKTVQKKVRNYSIKVTKDSIIINEDNNQMDVEAPITTEVEYDQVDHICPNTEEESSNNFVETNPVDINNVPFREDKINSANSSPPPSCSHVKPTYPIRGCLLKTTSDFEDKIKKSIIKTAKRDSISKKVSKNMVLKGDAKLKNIYVKIGGISKKKSNLKLVKMTQVKANTPTDEEVLSLEDLEF